MCGDLTRHGELLAGLLSEAEIGASVSETLKEPRGRLGKGGDAPSRNGKPRRERSCLTWAASSRRMCEIAAPPNVMETMVAKQQTPRK